MTITMTITTSVSSRVGQMKSIECQMCHSVSHPASMPFYFPLSYHTILCYITLHHTIHIYIITILESFHQYILFSTLLYFFSHYANASLFSVRCICYRIISYQSLPSLSYRPLPYPILSYHYAILSL